MRTKKSINRDKPGSQNEEKSWPQIVAIFLSCLPALICGYLYAWTSPSILKIIQDKENYDISDEEASYFTVLPFAAMIISCPIYAKINDSVGRKYAILSTGVIYIIVFILIIIAKNVWMFYLIRIIGGLAEGSIFSSIPIYVAEISSPKVRGTWGNILTLNIYLGEFLVNVIGGYFSIKTSAYISLVFPILFLITFPFMPESPYFYFMKGKHEEARASLKWLKKKENIEEEFQALKADVDRQMSETGTFKNLFTIRSNRKALIAGVFLRASQQLGGIGAFTVYTQYIFDKSGGSLSPQVSSMIFIGTLCILNFCAGFTLNIFGKRKSFLFSLISSGIVLLGCSIYYYVDQFRKDIDMSNLSWFPISSLLVFCVTYSFGVGIVPTQMLGELFSASIKVKGLSFMLIVSGILMSIINKLFHFLDNYIGLYCPFLFFACCCFVSSVMALTLVPETKGKTLEEIQQELKGNKRKKQSNV